MMETLQAPLQQLSDHWLSMGIDIALIIAMLMLWMSWYRNGQRQQALEQLLAGTAAQLEEATRHLAEATESIQALKQQSERDDTAENPPARRRYRQSETSMDDSDTDTTADDIAAMTYGRKRPSATSSATVEPVPQHSTQATMILRMHREGEDASAIADRLDMPLAQVKLMLKLHAPGNNKTPIRES